MFEKFELPEYMNIDWSQAFEGSAFVVKIPSSKINYLCDLARQKGVEIEFFENLECGGCRFIVRRVFKIENTRSKIISFLEKNKKMTMKDLCYISSFKTLKNFKKEMEDLERENIVKAVKSTTPKGGRPTTTWYLDREQILDDKEDILS